MKMTRRNFISTSAATMLACGVSLSAHAAGSESENGLNFITDIFSDPGNNTGCNAPDCREECGMVQQAGFFRPAGIWQC